MVTIDSLYKIVTARWYYRRLSTTYRLATIPHNWHTIVRYDPSRSTKVDNFYYTFVSERPYATFY